MEEKVKMKPITQEELASILKDDKKLKNAEEEDNTLYTIEYSSLEEVAEAFRSAFKDPERAFEAQRYWERIEEDNRKYAERLKTAKEENAVFYAGLDAKTREFEMRHLESKIQWDIIYERIQADRQKHQEQLAALKREYQSS